MNEKIIKVFYDRNGLPYKDKALTVHYPLIGNGFLGSSNDTKIRFYYSKIGRTTNTYQAVSKTPSGKEGSQVLSVKSSDEDGYYAELSLSQWYFQEKGDVLIALKVYRGGCTITTDPETGFQVVDGDPVIQTTGSIKLGVNYAPIGSVPDFEDNFTTYFDILALMGDKADTNQVPLLIDLSQYSSYQELYDVVGTRPFIAPYRDSYSICKFGVSNPPLYDKHYLLINSSYGLYETGELTMTDAISFESVVDKIYVGVDTNVSLYETSGTLTDLDKSKLQKSNASITYDDREYLTYYWSNSYNSRTFANIETQVNASTGEISFIERLIVVNFVAKTYSMTTNTKVAYTKTQVDTLLADKQDKFNVGYGLQLVGGVLSCTISGFSIEIVNELPAVGQNGVFYLVPIPQLEQENRYAEYIWVATNSAYEKLGEFGTDVDITGYVKDVEITSIKTVSEVITEIGGLNQIFTFDLMGIKYIGLFVEGANDTTDLELWTESGTSKVTDIDTTQLFRTEIGNAVVDKIYLPIVSLTQPITTLSDEEMTILGQNNSVIVYGGRVYVKAHEISDSMEFVCADVDDASENGYHTQSKYEITVNKSTKGTNVITSNITYYDKGQVDNLIANKPNKWVGAYVNEETEFTPIMQVGDIVMENTGGQFLINDIAFSGTTLTKVVLVGLEDNGNPVVHKYENSAWSSSNYVDTAIAPLQEGTINVINASDIVNNTLTVEQYKLITNGKPTRIKGVFLDYKDMFVFNVRIGFGGYCMCIFKSEEANGRAAFGIFRIVQSNRSCALWNTYWNFVSVGGKELGVTLYYTTLSSGNVGAITSTSVGGMYRNTIAISGTTLNTAIDVRVKMSNGAVYPAINNGGSELVIFNGVDFVANSITVTTVYYKIA